MASGIYRISPAKFLTILSKDIAIITTSVIIKRYMIISVLVSLVKWISQPPPKGQLRVRFPQGVPSCGYKKDIRSKNRATARFFDARKPGFEKSKT